MTTRLLTLLTLLLTACGPSDGIGSTVPVPAVSVDTPISQAQTPAVPSAANTKPERLPFHLFPDPSPDDYIVALKIVSAETGEGIQLHVGSVESEDAPAILVQLGSLSELLDDRAVDGNPHYGRLVDDIQRAILKAADSEERVRNLRVLIEMNPDSNESSVLKLKSTVPWGFVTMVIDAVMELSKVLYHSERRHASIPITFSNPPSAPGAD